MVPTLRTLLATKNELESIVQKQIAKALQDYAFSLQPLNVNDLHYYVEIVSEKSREELGIIADHIRSKDQNAVIVFVSEINDQQAILISLSKKLTTTLNANKIMKEITKAYGGSGGGRNDFANGSLKEKPELTKLIALVKQGANG